MYTLRAIVLYFSFTAVSAQTSPTSPLDAENWMSKNLDKLGGRTLRQLCMPGTHNSGLNRLSGGGALAVACNSLRQSLSVRGQLHNGARYLDLRPVLSKDRFLTGNYFLMTGGIWHGANGQPMEEIVNEINEFTRRHNELIIVSISNSLNTDLGPTNYRGFNEQEWERLFMLLDRTNDLLIAPKNVYLPSQTLGQLIDMGKQSSVIYIIDDPASRANLGERWGKGFYYPQNMQMYHVNSRTNDLYIMADDQIRKMKEAAPRQFFLLTWSLTQRSRDSAMCAVNLGSSTLDLAKAANQRLRDMIMYELSPKAFPNVLLVDDLNSTGMLETALSINFKFKTSSQRSKTPTL